MTCSPRPQDHPNYPWTERVDVKPFQAEVGRLLDDPEFSWGELCRRLDWMLVKPDTSRLKRVLGLSPNSDGKYQQTVQYETAVALCEALGVDPVDVGL